MTATPTDKLTPSQLAELWRRMAWGINRLDWRLAKYLREGPGSVPAGELGRFVGIVVQSAVAQEAVKNAALNIALIDPAWRDHLGVGTAATQAAAVAAIRIAWSAFEAKRPATWDQDLLDSFGVIQAGLKAGQDALNADLEWRGQIARSELAFWTRVLEITRLPREILKAIVKGVVDTALDVAKPLLGGLLEMLKPLLPYIAIAGGGYLLLRNVGRGKNSE